MLDQVIWTCSHSGSKTGMERLQRQTFRIAANGRVADPFRGPAPNPACRAGRLFLKIHSKRRRRQQMEANRLWDKARFSRAGTRKNVAHCGASAFNFFFPRNLTSSPNSRSATREYCCSGLVTDYEPCSHLSALLGCFMLLRPWPDNLSSLAE
jgi:hypothetical protein